MNEPTTGRVCSRCGGLVHLDAQDCGPAVGGVLPPQVNTHYAVITFSGDPAEEHPDETLRGRAPHFEFIAAGPEDFCWEALSKWTAKHPLMLWQEGEVLQRHPSVVRLPSERPSDA